MGDFSSDSTTSSHSYTNYSHTPTLTQHRERHNTHSNTQWEERRWCRGGGGGAEKATKERERKGGGHLLLRLVFWESLIILAPPLRLSCCRAQLKAARTACEKELSHCSSNAVPTLIHFPTSTVTLTAAHHRMTLQGAAAYTTKEQYRRDLYPWNLSTHLPSCRSFPHLLLSSRPSKGEGVLVPYVHHLLLF